jgi:hypothetical protein
LNFVRFRLGYKVKFSGLATKGSKRKLPLELNQKNRLLFKIDIKTGTGLLPLENDENLPIMTKIKHSKKRGRKRYKIERPNS